MRHSLRYFRHSGLVIYISKLPAPSVSMPCDYHILQSPTKKQVKLALIETAQAVSIKYKGLEPFMLIRAAPNEYFDTSPYYVTTRN